MDLHQIEESAEQAFDHALHMVKMKNILLLIIILGLAYLYLFVID
ncbi:hypothetical protein MmiHf6_09420 [Methanimicrococcus hongohii]|uniref:Uncharacterized protein n=1 Tax=Methanimicrococcus hongohii TaxID=3028295 RepID=A0AA97A1X9_9EURY|nr:hypothetical protein [Methanimicrococcus sp. Hf6]WNY23633.1 hypothetical protein MmiHf6_09420 [Methanimicrococcus sp. Hf6]